MDDKKRKQFVMPTGVLVDFIDEDIITASVQEEGGNDWAQYPDVDTFQEA